MGLTKPDGMSQISEYGSKFAADVAVARLAEYGIECSVFGDPAHSVAPHHVTQPGFVLLVLDDEVQDALEVLNLPADHEADALDQNLYQRRFDQRPAWVRGFTYLLLLAAPVPWLIMAIVLIVMGLQALFP